MSDTPIEALQPLLKKQRDSFHAEGFPSIASRRDRLSRLIKMLKKYEAAFCEALSEDFGTRPEAWTRFTEVVAAVANIQSCVEGMESWMQDETCAPLEPYGSGGAEGRAVYQPKGVVGVIGPWNFPIHLVVVPAANAIAAGNRVMMKPSEITPRSSEVLRQGIAEFFDETEVAVVTGDVSLSSAFSSLPFDHLVFTGSTAVGKIVLRAAAENLVPCTLELGGKSPVIIRPDADLPKACRRLVAAKMGNTGQWCVSPDYIYVPKELMEDFIEGCRVAFSELYATVENNPDYTSVVNDNHYQRLNRMVEDANQRGYQVVEFNPANESFDQAANRKMLLKCIVDPAWDSTVMGEEIFGPLLALLPYEDYDNVISTIKDGPRPLALYYYGENKEEQEAIIHGTISGGIAINDSCWHVASDEMPIGGIGDSGMGHYHGIYGFREFSHLRAVMVQTPNEEVTSFYYPPYSDALNGMMEELMGSIEL
ncbi:MAG: coniferyl aldehyde dehydrogenase [Halioglobus sp.]